VLLAFAPLFLKVDLAFGFLALPFPKVDKVDKVDKKMDKCPFIWLKLHIIYFI
jgi:hypothetical protein